MKHVLFIRKHGDKVHAMPENSLPRSLCGLTEEYDYAIVETARAISCGMCLRLIERRRRKP